eukprot:TRINITY_DN67014_c9_g7_i1.p1 TRINITY_DN67014_c9_g7~~TRINITY_DN67014_c9_g7_i1.p1  ORF type:complete len:222 (-),score=11.53 TRINITY_DN67014_c9_g7_i1:752-1417(-)
MPVWDSGLKTVASPGDHKRAHLRTAWKPQDSFSLSHDSAPVTQEDKTGEARHRHRPPQNEAILQHDPGFYSLGSPGGKRFEARKEVEKSQLERPTRPLGKRPATAERYQCQPESPKTALKPDNSQRFANKPADTGGLLQANEQYVNQHAPTGQRFASTPHGDSSMVTAPSAAEPPAQYDRTKLQRMRCTPPDGALSSGRSPESEQLRYYNSTANPASQLLC